LGWFFTLVFAVAGQPSTTMKVGAFTTQQACETRRLVMTSDMPAAKATPCTREHVPKGTPIIKNP
jgi:peroxiredoxin